MNLLRYLATPHGRKQAIHKADKWRDSRNGKWAHTAAVLVALIGGCAGTVTSVLEWQQAKWRHEDNRRRWDAQHAVNVEVVGSSKVVAQIESNAVNQAKEAK